MRISIAIVLVALALTPLAEAQDNAGQSKPTEPATEEIVILGEVDRRVFELAETVDIAPDSAALLKRAPGASVVTNGPLSGIAHYRGMSRFRISSQVDGALISPGGPNWMDTPLSYAPAAHLHSIEVYRGIAPVSAGMETIGGVINAKTWAGEFSDGDWTSSGRLRTGIQSVNEASLLSGNLVLANDQHRLKLSGLTESADDGEFAGGEILPSEYERQRFDVGYGLRLGRHSFQVTAGRSDTGDAGTAALPMDIQWIDADLASLSHTYEGVDVVLRNRVYYSNIDHGMTNYHLRAAPGDPAMFRRNLTDAENVGFAAAAETGDWKFGLEGHQESHNSDINNPNNAMFFVENFDHAERRILSLFAEREFLFRDSLFAEFGLRYKHVEADAREVNATPAMMGMPPAVALRDNFNARDRSRSEGNVDWAMRFQYSVDADLAMYAGIARKSRAPAYQEMYLWLPLQATGGLADGRTYTGSPDLDDEVAHELEIGLDWQAEAWTASPRLFYRDVDDYIQGTTSTNATAVQFVRMMNMMNGTSNADPLEFRNVDARFYGADLDWAWRPGGPWSVDGTVSYVRGERDDIDDDLYRIVAPNALVAVHYVTPAWGLTLDAHAFAGQDDVSETNSETASAGYAILGMRGFWQISQRMRLGFGVDNLADRLYRDHLAGVNRAGGNPDLARGERLPGHGRGGFLRLDYSW